MVRFSIAIHRFEEAGKWTPKYKELFSSTPASGENILLNLNNSPAETGGGYRH
jgi:hypothetical protein